MNDEPLTKPFSRLDSRVTLVLFVLDRMFNLVYELVLRVKPSYPTMPEQF